REHIPRFALKYRGRSAAFVRRAYPVQGSGSAEFTADWFVNDLEEPYTYPEDKPFSWRGRLRILGGRTNIWARQSYRLSDLDFKAASRDGFGMDWPVAYRDLAPYYDLVERYVGISGRAEGVYELPDGQFHPAMAMSCSESALRDRVRAKLGRVVTIGRTANITRPLGRRQPCHYCGPCERGCVTHSYFNAAYTTVADALASKRCTLIENAMAYQVLMDRDSRRARGILYIDRITHQPKEVFGKAVVLCAQALESVRMLLNSKSEQDPAGLANSSGLLGKYLMDHIICGGAIAEFPDLPVTPSMNAPHRPNGIYIIRFRNRHDEPASKKFLRGYGYQGSGAGDDFNFDVPGFGRRYKDAVKKPRPSVVGLTGFGECLPYEDNYVEIDPQVVDTYGIPVLRVHARFKENEQAMITDIGESAAEMLEAAGGKNIRLTVDRNRPFGAAIHEVGIARMGGDQKRAVLNGFQQSWDVRNLFVMDGAGFTSSACQNPTLTIMALAVRSCDYLVEQAGKGEL
ncbi:MAG: GMC oxidoreductase, partial [Vicinamibacteraceae bacterium]